MESEYRCKTCGTAYLTELEAKACNFIDGNGGEPPSLDFVKPIGHEGPHHA